MEGSLYILYHRIFHPKSGFDGMGSRVSRYECIGYLSSRLDHIRTRSEGPEYFLQLLDPEDIYRFPEGILHLLKGEGVASWQHDEALCPLLGCKVIVSGILEEDCMEVESIELVDDYHVHDADV
jgi:hypothetical protein